MLKLISLKLGNKKNMPILSPLLPGMRDTNLHNTNKK